MREGARYRTLKREVARHAASRRPKPPQDAHGITSLTQDHGGSLGLRSSSVRWPRRAALNGGRLWQVRPPLTTHAGRRVRGRARDPFCTDREWSVTDEPEEAMARLQEMRGELLT